MTCRIGGRCNFIAFIVNAKFGESYIHMYFEIGRELVDWLFIRSDLAKGEEGEEEEEEGEGEEGEEEGEA